MKKRTAKVKVYERPKRGLPSLSSYIFIIIIIKFKFIPRSFYKNIQLRLTINIKLEIKIEVQNYNSKIMQFNYKNYRTN